MTRTGGRATVGVERVEPLSPDRWEDLERLFGPSGAYSNCWCTYFRQTGAEFSAGCAGRGRGNRALLRRLTDAGTHPPGLIAYRSGAPVGWVSVGPRDDFGRIVRSPVARPVMHGAGPATWSIVCFFVPRAERGRGVARGLLAAAVAHARAGGARTVEGYPVDAAEREPGASIYTGTVDLFRDAGFGEVARAVDRRPVMRLDLG